MSCITFFFSHKLFTTIKTTTHNLCTNNKFFQVTEKNRWKNFAPQQNCSRALFHAYDTRVRINISISNVSALMKIGFEFQNQANVYATNDDSHDNPIKTKLPLLRNTK